MSWGHYSEFTGKRGNQAPSVADVLSNSMSDIRGRLSFSAVNMRPLLRSATDVDSDIYSPRNGHHLKQHSHWSSSYHQSKQDPSVLDKLHPPPDPSLLDVHKTPFPAIGPAHGHQGVNNGTWLQSPGSLQERFFSSTPPHHRHPPAAAAGSPSLVQLAVRGWQGRRSNGYTVSPVVVRLAGPEAARERESVLRRDTRGQASSSQLRDPCDKEVVMEALKQKRKRRTSLDLGYQVGPSAAKKTRLEVDPVSNDHSFVDLTRKKLGESPSDAVMLALSQPSSSSAGGISDGSCTTTSGGRRKVRIPSILLCEEEEPVTRMEEGGEGERSASEASEKGQWNGVAGNSSRSTTPLLANGPEAQALEEQRDEICKVLNTVFPPKLSKKESSVRREVPVLCGTGSKPYLPAPLTRNHLATEEDLKKDREAVALRIKRFLATDDVEDNSKCSKVLSRSSSPSLLARGTASSPVAPPSSKPSPISLLGSLPSASLPAALPQTTKSSLITSQLPLIGSGAHLLQQQCSTASLQPPPAPASAASSSSLPATATNTQRQPHKCSPLVISTTAPAASQASSSEKIPVAVVSTSQRLNSSLLSSQSTITSTATGVSLPPATTCSASVSNPLPSGNAFSFKLESHKSENATLSQNQTQPQLMGQNQLLRQNQTQPQLLRQNQMQPQLLGQNQTQPQLLGQNQTQPQLLGQNQTQPQLLGQNQTQPQLLRQNQTQPQLLGQNQTQPQLLGQNQTQPQLLGQNQTQPQLLRQNQTQPQLLGQNQTQPQLLGQNQTQPQLLGQNQTQPQLLGQNQTQPQLLGQNQTQPQLLGQNQTQPQLLGQNQTQPQLLGQNQTQPQLLGQNQTSKPSLFAGGLPTGAGGGNPGAFSFPAGTSSGSGQQQQSASVGQPSLQQLTVAKPFQSTSGLSGGIFSGQQMPSSNLPSTAAQPPLAAASQKISSNGGAGGLLFGSQQQSGPSTNTSRAGSFSFGSQQQSGASTFSFMAAAADPKQLLGGGVAQQGKLFGGLQSTSAASGAGFGFAAAASAVQSQGALNPSAASNIFNPSATNNSFNPSSQTGSGQGFSFNFGPSSAVPGSFVFGGGQQAPSLAAASIGTTYTPNRNKPSNKRRANRKK